MRIKFDIDVVADAGTATGCVSQRVMLVVPPTLCLVGDLSHHLHRRFALPKQPLTLAVDGFTLLPSQRLTDILRDEDIVMVRIAGAVHTVDSPCAAKRRRVVRRQRSGLLALEDGLLALTAPVLANEGEAVVAPRVHSAGVAVSEVADAPVAQSTEDAAPSLPRDRDVAQSDFSSGRRRKRGYLEDQGRKQSSTLQTAKFEKKCSFGHEVFPALAPPVPVRPAPGALPRSSTSIHEDETEAPAAASTDGGARAIWASRGKMMRDPSARTMPPLLPQLDCKQWKAVARDPWPGEVVKYRAAGKSGLSAYQVAWCRDVDSSEDGAICVFCGADGIDQRLPVSALLQVSVYIDKSSASALSAEKVTKADGVTNGTSAVAEASASLSVTAAGLKADVAVQQQPMMALQEHATAEACEARPSQENSALAAQDLDKLRRALVRQIDYYFGDVNYPKDNWLRSQADMDGWTSLELVAKFNRMRDLTNDFPLVLECALTSDVVEVSECGYYIRKL